MPQQPADKEQLFATKEETEQLRRLARRYAEIAALDTQAQRRERMRDNNDLNPGRPPVLIDEVPWHEMDIDGKLQLRCVTPFAREMEWFFRRRLFAWEYFPADMVMEDVYALSKTVHSTGNGLEVDETVHVTDQKNTIVSHEYHDQLATDADLERMHMPVITTDEEWDARRLQAAQEILDGILPVKLRGLYVYYAPWDQIPRYRGVEPILLDMVDRPEFLHRIIEKFTQEGLCLVDQYEKLGLLELDIPDLHCTPPYVSDLPAPDYQGGKPRAKDVWFRTMAQMFSTVSPAMQKEFDLDYSKRLYERFGLVYYGCCEPLDNKIALLKEMIPNLRKIGVSPWANVQSSAEQMGKNYVYARKPNPANVAIQTDPEVIRAEISETVEACEKYGCPYEFVLKDISTVSYRPENLIVWERTVREVLDGYYGKRPGC